MSFNLNNAVDFAKVTNSALVDPLALLQQLLGGLSGRREWRIEEASFDGIKFHIFKTVSDYSAGVSDVVDSSGNRLAIFKFPYKSGQTTENMGRDGYNYSFNVMFHGPKYKVGFNALKRRFDEITKPGDLVHPIYGVVTVQPGKWKFTHSSETHQAVLASIEFVEHSFSIGNIASVEDDPTPKTALSGALALLAKIDSALTTIQATVSIARSLAFSIGLALQEISDFFRSSLTGFNFTFTGGASNDSPEAVLISEGGLVGSGGEQGANATSVSSSPSNQNNLSTSDTDAITLTTEQIIAQVNEYRGKVEALLQTFASNGIEIDVYELILTLKQSANTLKTYAERGIKSSQPSVINYVLPRNMSMREIAFENGLSPDDVAKIDALNPFVESTNEIFKGTTIQVPTNVIVARAG